MRAVDPEQSRHREQPHDDEGVGERLPPRCPRATGRPRSTRRTPRPRGGAVRR